MERDTELLFHELAGLSQEERAEYFAVHGIAPEMRAELESLLRNDQGPLRLREGVAAGVEEWLHSGPSLVENEAGGRYRLVRLLGRGGMGAVYLAQRSNGQIEQAVAIKFLRYSADTPSLKDRFLRERQILASLQHPGIVRLLDAGHTNEGQLFLVMDYVDGTPIDVYCEKLAVRAKLELFLQVCEAVAYAHRNLIIHRDLKPSNILVDESGCAKLLDFGIAKILDATMDQTRTRERMLTPEYASPEQVRGTAQSTATDVYSLGAVLYKLLTGRSPHVFDEGAGEAIEAVVCTKEPVAASRVNPAIPKDLDFILGMALRKEPQLRYATVETLAEDIRAFLEWRPVRARSGDTWYRARKFLRRYWIPVAAASVAAAGLTGGLVVASRERAIAQKRFDEVRQLSDRLIEIDFQVRELPGGAKTRQFIVDTSLDYLRRLSADVRGDPALAMDLGHAYLRVARVQGVPIGANLGQVENAEKSLRAAQALVDSVLQAQPTNRTAFIRAAQIAHDRMVLAQGRRPNTEALPLARKADEWLEKYLDSGKVDDFVRQQVTIVATNVAGWYVHEDLMDDALRLIRRGIAIAMATNQPRSAGSLHINLARALRSTGDLDGALVAAREAVRLLEPAVGNASVGQDVGFALALSTQGAILGEADSVSLQRPQEAVETFERAYRIATGLAQRDPNDTLSRFSVFTNGSRLAGTLRQTDPQRGLAICDEVLLRLNEIHNNSRARRNEVSMLVTSAYLLRRIGRPAESRERLNTAFGRLRELKMYPAEQVELGSEPEKAIRALAEEEAADGNARRGIEIYEDLLSKIMATKPKPESRLADAYDLSTLYRAMAVLHRKVGQTDSAGAMEARRTELWQHWDRKLPKNTFVRRQLEETPASR